MFVGERCIRVCCGPRCGSEPAHRAVFAAVERLAGDTPVVPTGCRSRCGDGVTVVLTGGATIKIRDAREAEDVFAGNDARSGEGIPADCRTTDYDI